MKKFTFGQTLLMLGTVVCTVALASLIFFQQPEWKTTPLPETPKLQTPELQTSTPEIENKLKPYLGPSCKLDAQTDLNQIIREIDRHPEWKDAKTQEFIIYSLPECVGSWYEVNEIRHGQRYIGRIYKQKVSAIKDDVNHFVYSGYIHGYAPEKINPLFEKFGVQDQAPVIY